MGFISFLADGTFGYPAQRPGSVRVRPTSGAVRVEAVGGLLPNRGELGKRVARGDWAERSLASPATGPGVPCDPRGQLSLHSHAREEAFLRL